jgi:hypothetical protein
MPSVGIVVPAYRPDPDQLVSYCRALETTVDPDTIRIELDAASDAVRDALAAAPATVNAVDTRRGKGAAITAGFDALDESIRVFADGDGSTPATSIADLIAPITADSADLTAGSRRHPEAVVDGHQTRARRRMGDGFAWLARRVLPVPLHDYQCGAKAIDAETWSAVRPHLYEAGFAWDIELVTVADALGYRVREVPVEWTDQPGSTVEPLTTALELWRALFRSRRRARRLGRMASTNAGDRNDEGSLAGRVPLIDRHTMEGRDE